MKRLLLLFLFAAPFAARPDEKAPLPLHTERERTYHVVHYRLTIDIDEKAKTCRGDALIRLVPLRPLTDEICLDANGLVVSAVTVDGKSAAHRENGDSLVVGLDRPAGLGDTLGINVSYSVTAPKQGLYFVKPDSGYPKKQWQVWSNGEATENHYWFPCYDFPNDRATSEMIVSVNEKWTAISNGKLIDVRRDPRKHRATYHWLESKPHVSYLISLVAGEYTEVKDSWGSVPLSYYVYTFQKDDALRSFGKSADIMEFYSSKIGVPYQWEKYAQTVVQDYILGGQENVSATTLTDGTIHDARAHLDYQSDGLVAHEMAHQWFGDLMTCRDWSHLWLNEGFASYFDVLYQEHDKGVDVALKSIADAQHNIVTTDFGDKRRPTVATHYMNPNDLFDNRIYGKGACVLHMMRGILGDELFWKAINHYVEKHKFGVVETNDLLLSVADATGYNLDWFFDEWLYHPGFPEYDVSMKWDPASRMERVTVKQVQKVDSATGLFRMPVDIEVWTHDEPQLFRVDVSQAESTYAFPSYQEPQLVIFDKSSRILKKATVHNTTEQWLFQLTHAEYAVDRLAAVEELRWISDTLRVLHALRTAGIEDRSPDVRREALQAVADAKSEDMSDFYIAAYGDKDSRIRAAAVRGMAHCRKEAVLGTLKHAFEKDSSYVVAASALTSLCTIDTVNATAVASAGLLRDSFREGIRIAALRALSDVGSEEAYTLVRNATVYGNDRNVRMEAFNQLSKKWKDRPDVIDYMISAVDDPSFHVRRAVMEMLGNVGNPKALDILKQVADSDPDTRLTKVASDAAAKIEKRQQEQKQEHK